MKRSSSSFGFELGVEKALQAPVAALLERHGLVDKARELRYTTSMYGSDWVRVSVADYPLAVREELLTVLAPDPQAVTQLRAYNKLMEDPGARVAKLTLLPAAIASRLAKNVIDGWLYKQSSSGQRLAYGVDYVKYTPADGDSPAYVQMGLVYNAPSSRSYGSRDGVSRTTTTVTWHFSDLGRNNVEQLLLAEGFWIETAELRAEYESHWSLFQQYGPQYGKQFEVFSGELQEDEAGSVERPLGGKYVNDEQLVERSLSLTCELGAWATVLGLDPDNLPTDRVLPFTRIPVHLFVYMFNLTTHTNQYIHVANMRPYRYQPEVINKLVLPESHTDLLEALTADISIFAGDQDVVRGKSGGVPILCFGAPGLGKTLTAEVYSEMAKKPLYRVHSGQLGTTFESVEKNLEQILKRAERWGAILLLDEADVYVSKRGDDLAKNAVVAAFLRTLEYFNGILFLTTNRMDDVDDAILSRMIAMIKYELPKTASESYLLWSVLLQQFDSSVTYTTKQVDLLVKSFPTLAGRDIKQLIRLTRRYCAAKQISEFNLDAFRICATFRGLK